MDRTEIDTLRCANLRLLESEEHADAMFLIGPEKQVMKVHRLVLVSRSPVFKEFFAEDWCARHEDDDKIAIHIPSTSVSSFRFFLQFMYADKLDSEAGISETMSLLALAHKFKVQPLLSKCDTILASKFDLTHSAMEWYAVARRCSANVIMTKIEDEIAGNFHQFTKSGEFLIIDEELLTKLLRRDDLNMEEIDLFEAVVRWGNDRLQDEENQHRLLSSVLENLLPLIRFPTMTFSKFALVVRPTKLLPDADMVDIYTYLASSGEQKNELCGTLKYGAVPRTGRNFESFETQAQKRTE